MVKQHLLRGYDEYVKYIETLDPAQNNLHFLFIGSTTENGHNWCPDCVALAPHLQRAVAKTSDDFTLVTVEVGDKAFWKDCKCPFRTDRSCNLKYLPTLLNWAIKKERYGQMLYEDQHLHYFLTNRDKSGFPDQKDKLG